jgi:hypothetical protein
LLSKQSGLKYRQKATRLRHFGLHAWKVGHFQEIPPMEAEIKIEKVLCSSIKVLLVIDRLQPNKRFYVKCVESKKREVSGTSLQWLQKCSRKGNPFSK